MPCAENSSALRGIRLQVCYLYSFLFSGFDLSSLLNNSTAEKRFIAQLRQQDRRLQTAQIHWGGGESKHHPTREETDAFYLDPYVHLRVPHIHFEWTDGPVVLEKSVGTRYVPFPGKVFLRSRVRLLESGWGTAFYFLDIVPHKEGFVTRDEIVEIANLGMRVKYSFQGADEFNRRSSRFRLAETTRKGSRETWLFERFWTDVTATRSALETAIRETARRRASRGELPPNIEWIEVDEGLVGLPEGTRDPRAKHSLTQFQFPFPLMYITLPPACYCAMFLAPDETAALANVIREDQSLLMNAIRIGPPKEQYEKDLLTILYRSQAPNLPDITFAESVLGARGSRLPNMCSCGEMFIQLHTRGCVALSTMPAPYWGGPSNNVPPIQRDVRAYLVPKLLSTVSFLRCRWHAYAVASVWLDRALHMVVKGNGSYANVLEEILRIRSILGLGMADVITYRAASGSLHNVYTKGVVLFRIEELENVAIAKLRCLEGLLFGGFELRRLKSTRRSSLR